jgi:hypothetical protein
MYRVFKKLEKMARWPVVTVRLKKPHYKCYFNGPIHRRYTSGIYVAATVAARRALYLTADRGAPNHYY